MIPRRFRTQVQAAHVLIALAVFMALPLSKPGLWVLEVWGDFRVPPFLWTLIFGAVGLLLLRTHKPRPAQYGMMIAAVLFWTIAAAAWLSLGWNGMTIMAAVKGLHCVWTAIDLKALAEHVEARVVPKEGA